MVKRTRNGEDSPQVKDSVVGKSEAQKEALTQIRDNAFQPADEPAPERVWGPDDLLPTGSTLLNCACSDTPFGGFGTGTIVTIPGASKGGKTVLALTTFAEVNLFPRFDEYAFIFDDAEQSQNFNMIKLFGPGATARIRPPRVDKKTGEPIYSNTIQDFEGNVLQACRSGRPFIYVEDSLDTLSSDEELEREYLRALLRETNPEKLKDLAGSYHTEKARIIGETLRIINGELKKTRSVLIMIQQERDNIGRGYGERESTTSGGRAPFFYSTHQIWLKRVQTLTSTIGGNKLKIGSASRLEVTKNKMTGKERTVEVDIYNDYGVDDVTSCVDFLVKNHWKKESESRYNAEEFDVVGTPRAIVRAIEAKVAEMSLRQLVGTVWREIEEKARLTDRKRRFAI